MPFMEILEAFDFPLKVWILHCKQREGNGTLANKRRQPRSLIHIT